MVRFWKSLLLVLAANLSYLHAEPQGFDCKAGDAHLLSQQAGKWTIQSQSDSIIHWDSFSIELGEVVHFEQGGSHSAILNRVVGDSKSQLLGHLSSNGKVFLLNPNGVLIGPNGRIETAGFIASSFDMMDEEFLNAKEMLFRGLSKESVVNLGTIQCQTGDVALIGLNVQNEGTIEAPNGVVSLAAGLEILLKPEGTQRVFIKVEGTEESIEHTGSIQALAAEMRTASPYAKAIRSSGSIEACAVEENGGRIYLVAEKGTIELQGSKLKGNTVHVLGEEIRIEKSEIDVSGENEGGTILVGGDYQGSVAYAERVFVDADTIFSADALTQGNGGKVICWSDDQMAHFGKVNARGGAEGGDGGLVEISGKQNLVFEGLVDTMAPFGKPGTLLLDPSTITISTGIDTGSYDATTGTWQFNTKFINNVVNTTTLQNQLNSTNVTIMTPDPTYDVADPTITVANTITWTAPTTLTLVASSVFINAAIINNVGGSGLTLTGYGNAAPNTSAAGVAVSANLSFPLGTVTFQGCVGGTGTGGNHGVAIPSGVTVNAYNIIARDCYGGLGMTTDVGFYLDGGTLGSTTTQNIYISGGSLGLGSNEYGVKVLSGTVQVGNGGTISLVGTGGGTYNGTGNENYGVQLSSATVIAGNGGSAAATINITGIGGTGSGGLHHGVKIDTGTTFNLNSSNPASAINIVNCVGGIGGASNTAVEYEVSTNLVNGSVNFQNIMGGSGGSGGATTSNGVYIPSGNTLSAPVITAADCFGGPGTGKDIGFYVNGATLGSSSANLISITGGSVGIGFGEVGIQIDTGGQIIVGNGGTINLMGTGGGLYNNTLGGDNYGVYLSGCTLTAGNGGSAPVAIDITGIGGTGYGGFTTTVDNSHGINIDTSIAVNLNSTSPANSLNFLNCLGGSGGTSNYGVNFATSLSLANGSLNFQNIAGGSGGSGTTGHHGVMINSGVTVTAPAIIASDCTGGPGAGSDIGFYVNGGTLGSSIANQISVMGGSLGGGSSEVGIQVDTSGQIIVGNNGTIALFGTGGGVYNGSGSNNNGVLFNGCTLTAGNGGSQATTINVTGIGGSGSGGTHYGVDITTGSFAVNLDDANPASSLNFKNCIGGSGGTSNYGINFNASLNLVNGSLNLQNITGGSGGSGTSTHHHGVMINSGITVSAPAIIASECFAGPGTGSDIGFDLTGTLGSIATNQISITAGSLGSGGGEYGINAGGAILVGDSGTISLSGSGGGLYNGGGTQNFGINFTAALTAGNGGTPAVTVNITGMGGTGSGGGNYGVKIGPGSAFNLNSQNPASAINFVHCIGGNGGASNYGVNYVTSTTLVNGSMNFQNITGGSGGSGITNHHGVLINTGVTLSAPVITAADCFAGPGTGNDIGFYINNGSTLGSSSTNLISVIGDSLGTGSSEIGIQVNPSSQIIVGNGGTITLLGTGGGLYNNILGGNNYGVYLNGCTLTAGNGGSAPVAIGITGIGGTGYGGSSTTVDHSHGVNIGTSIAVNLNSTSPANSLTFHNCLGGSGGVANYGVNFATSLNLANGSLNFENITGGSGGSGTTNHHGVVINSGVTVTAPTIIATDCLGGPGTGTDIGFYVTGGTLGSSITNQISITGGSLGTGSNEIGIQVDPGGQLIVGNGGTISLFGIGGGIYNGTGSNNYGVNFAICTLTAGNGEAKRLQSMLQGSAGAAPAALTMA